MHIHIYVMGDYRKKALYSWIKKEQQQQKTEFLLRNHFDVIA